MKLVSKNKMSSKYTKFYLSLLLLVVLEFNNEAATKSIITGAEKWAKHFEYKRVSPDNVTFYLLHPESLQNPTKLKPSKKIILIIHGWRNSAESSWIQTMAQEYVAIYKNSNVVSVDWHKLADDNYFAASTAVQSVGNIAAEILWELLEKNPDRLDNVHVIGHSLGAHVAGFLGKKIEDMTGNKIDRITGLDAAGPLFTTPVLRPTSLRLDKRDAKFVDVYHTDIHLFGESPPAGQIDVYWNCGGKIQPECREHRRILEHPLGAVECSHTASHVLFTQTIGDPKLYPAGRCALSNKGEEVVDSGEFVSREVSGMFCGSTVHNSVERCNKLTGIL